MDVFSNHRQKSVGMAVMNNFTHIANENACEALGLGADKMDVAANALYRSLDPNDIDEVVGHNLKLDGLHR